MPLPEAAAVKGCPVCRWFSVWCSRSIYQGTMFFLLTPLPHLQTAVPGPGAPPGPPGCLGDQDAPLVLLDVLEEPRQAEGGLRALETIGGEPARGEGRRLRRGGRDRSLPGCAPGRCRPRAPLWASQMDTSYFAAKPISQKSLAADLADRYLQLRRSLDSGRSNPDSDLQSMGTGSDLSPMVGAAGPLTSYSTAAVAIPGGVFLRDIVSGQTSVGSGSGAATGPASTSPGGSPLRQRVPRGSGGLVGRSGSPAARAQSRLSKTGADGPVSGAGSESSSPASVAAAAPAQVAGGAKTSAGSMPRVVALRTSIDVGRVRPLDRSLASAPASAPPAPPHSKESGASP